MRLSTIFILSFFSLSFLTKTVSQDSYVDNKGNTHLLGDVQIHQLESEEYSEWFTEGIKSYISNIEPHQAENLNDVKVKVFIGTWCGDTKNYLPKFIKTWKEAGLKESQLEITALHREGKEYKRSPNRTELNYNIHRVPTFVFERNNKEIGRIVERPLNDLTTDITQIAMGVPSQARYRAVALLHEYINSTPEDSLYANFQPVLNKMYRNVSGPGELNTLGYVLMAAERYVEAEMAFRANARIFRYNPNLQDSLGELFMEIEKYPEAKECFEKVLQLKIEDTRATEMLGIISEKLEN